MFFIMRIGFAEISPASAYPVSYVRGVEYWKDQVQSFWSRGSSDCSKSVERLLCPGLFLFSLNILLLKVGLYSSRLVF